MLKPMNCPHATSSIFDSEKRSYRDLPIRLAEFGTVYRWEQSGELGGMTRVRGFTQDDAHLFCREDQLPGEVNGCLELVKIVFSSLGMTDFRVRVGLRDPDGTKYVGEPEQWDRAEAACLAAAQLLGVPFTSEPGEAAFYGPKIDFVVKDVIGREWQLGTVQVDYQLPQRFELEYVGSDNKTHRPVMVHRAPFGSMERFVGVLIEHFNGAFPLWLAPEQVRIMPVSDKFLDYARKVHGACKAAGLRAVLDDANDRVNAKIKVPRTRRSRTCSSSAGAMRKPAPSVSANAPPATSAPCRSMRSCSRRSARSNPAGRRRSPSKRGAHRWLMATQPARRRAR